MVLTPAHTAGGAPNLATAIRCTEDSNQSGGSCIGETHEHKARLSS